MPDTRYKEIIGKGGKTNQENIYKKIFAKN